MIVDYHNMTGIVHKTLFIKGLHLIWQPVSWRIEHLVTIKRIDIVGDRAIDGNHQI